MRNTLIDVHPVSGAVGAEILGIDIAARHPDQVWAEIRATLNEYGVIFFRDQKITPDDHVAFAEHFGRIHTSPFLKGIDEAHPQIGEVRKEEDQTRNIGGGWHTDHAYNKTPALGSILVARQLPDSGGDTLFLSMGAAYDALSDGLKQALEGLRAIHTNEHVFGPKSRARIAAHPNMVNLDAASLASSHPVVIRHPETGRKILYVNPSYTTHIEGWTVEESRPLLQMLYRHAERPEFQCRFRWREGSVAFWDNRAVWHYAANDYHGHRRLMHRITIAGVALG